MKNATKTTGGTVELIRYMGGFRVIHHAGPKSAVLGNYYGDNYEGTDPAGYGGSAITGGPYHFCYNPQTGTGEPSPPGSHGRLGWIAQLDLGVTYKPSFADGKLALRLDVFNVTNSQVATNLNSQMYRDATGKSLQYLYGTPAVLQAPRYVRFGVTYDY